MQTVDILHKPHEYSYQSLKVKMLIQKVKIVIFEGQNLIITLSYHVHCNLADDFAAMRFAKLGHALLFCGNDVWQYIPQVLRRKKKHKT